LFVSQEADVSTGEEALVVRDGWRRLGERVEWVSIFRTGTVFAVVGVVWLIFWQLTPYFLTKDNLYNVGLQSSNLAIIASGLTIVLIAAEIDLSIGAIQALTGSLAAVLIIRHESPVWVGIVVVLIAGPLLGVANGLVTWKLRIPSFIATLAMLGVAQGTAFLITDNAPINGFPDSYLNIFTGRIFGDFPIAVVIAFGVLLGTHYVLNHTRLGRHIYAVGGDAETAALSGIVVGRVKLVALAISGLTAAIGGLILSARLNAGSGEFGTEDLLPAVAAVVIGGTSLFGGRGSVWGTAGGVLLLASITNGLILVNVQSAWQEIIVGLIIVGAMLLDQVLKAEWSLGLDRVAPLRRLLRQAAGRDE
jgi:ribose/xylose/arabinose/galactoside ABC-type transport system permease subunit